MRITILVCLCLILSKVLVAGVITSGEFFVDTDPGEGSGYYIDGNYDTDSVTVNTSYNTTGLSFGCHWIFVRFKDDEHWGKPQASLFWNIDPNGKSILAGEYYFDTDPGVGGGQALEGNFGNKVVTANYNNFNTSNLTLGTHFLYVRFMDSSLQWGNAQATILNISNSTHGSIECGEYFIDTDPGIGQAEALTGSYNGSVFVASAPNVPIYMLSEGDHNVYVRFKDSLGNWGSAKSYKITVVHDAPELIKNGGCEDAIVNGNISSWDEVLGTNWTRNNSIAAYQGTYYFHPTQTINLAELKQDVDVSAYSLYIDSGNQNFVFSGYVRSYPQNPIDFSRIKLEYLNASKNLITLGYDTGNSSNTAQWDLKSYTGLAPVGTRYVRIRLISTRNSTTDNNDGYYDALSLKAPLANGPQFSNITVLQREDETKKVDIYYSMSHDQPLTISLQVSKDNGATWDVPCTMLTGDIGRNISPGLGKHIIWNVLLDQPDINFSNYVFRLVATDGVLYGSITSGQVEIDAVDENYSNYRIVPVSQAPNPAILQIPEGGYGYAWFAVEGFRDNVWMPILTNNIEAVDAQENVIHAKTGRLPYKFITGMISMQNIGVFALPICYDIIGNGNPESQEIITVNKVNNLLIAPQNRQSVPCRIIPYKYKSEWGYRLYSKGGAGISAGIVTATGFAGGGSGATVSLDLEGLGSNPDYNSLKISRRDDIFAGFEVELGPPPLFDIASASVSAQVSFPYENEYEFDLSQIDGLEALMAYYLLAEPIIIHSPKTRLNPRLSTDFLSYVVQVLINNNANNGLGIARVSDETGLDIEGSIGFSTNLLAGLPLALRLGPGFDLSSHFGTSSKRFTNSAGIYNGKLQNRIYLGSEFNITTNAGPKLIPNMDVSTKFFYPHGLNSIFFPQSGNSEYELLCKWNEGYAWDSVELSSKTGSTNTNFKIYDLPGQMQEYKVSLIVNRESVKNLLFNATQIPSKLWNIGTAEVNLVTNNSTFSQDYANFLGTIYNEQNRDLPVQLGYAISCEDKSAYNFNFDLPLPIAGLIIKLGGGLEATNSNTYNIADGYWVKGYQYLQTEMLTPPQPSVTFSDVRDYLWDKIVHGNIWSELKDVIESQIRDGWLKFWNSRTNQINILNNKGSYIILTENSIPGVVDSVLFRNWDWSDEPIMPRLSLQKREAITRYNKNLRRISERNVGMRYGIGGFYKFESTEENWNQSPQLTIKYLDNEIAGLDENTLKMYWEDNSGVWHVLPSSAVPDSNLVRADIPYFTTYTLAPSLPQGRFNMTASPDSILADGISTTQVTSTTLFNNDGSIVTNGALYTVLLDRGEIITADADLSMTGKQIAALGGCISFTVRADSLPVPIVATVNSSCGYAQGSITIHVFKVTGPNAPLLLSVQSEHRALKLTWQQVSDPSIIGYKIYYDNDTSGSPYSGVSNVFGENSPVTTGNVSNYTLNGLNNDDHYYIRVTAIDAYGNESILSNELIAQPILNAVHDLMIIQNETGTMLSWSPSVGAESFKVYRGNNPNSPLTEMEFVTQTVQTHWTDFSAQTSDKCFYRVIAIGY